MNRLAVITDVHANLPGLAVTLAKIGVSALMPSTAAATRRLRATSERGLRLIEEQTIRPSIKGQPPA